MVVLSYLFSAVCEVVPEIFDKIMIASAVRQIVFEKTFADDFLILIIL